MLDGIALAPLIGDTTGPAILVLVLVLLVTGRLVPKREVDRVVAEADRRIAREQELGDARVAREAELGDARVARERELAEAWEGAWGAERAVSAQAIAQRDALVDEYARTADHVLSSLPHVATDDPTPAGGS